MNMKENKQILPKWFNGELYKKGEVVTNPNSGFSIELNNVELSMYDFIIGAQLVMDMGMYHSDMIGDFQKGLDWFKENNAEAYMILLD